MEGSSSTSPGIASSFPVDNSKSIDVLKDVKNEEVSVKIEKNSPELEKRNESENFDYTSRNPSASLLQDMRKNSNDFEKEKGMFELLLDESVEDTNSWNIVETYDVVTFQTEEGSLFEEHF